MSDVWLDLAACLLRPARPAPRLARCLAERERHLALRKKASDERARAMTDCERRIEQARAAVFAASDGVVSAKMTALEREWRSLARVDRDGGVMDLWGRIVPAPWLDEKRWRSCPAVDRVDLCVALASDVEGVEAAERAARAFLVEYAKEGFTVGGRIAWRFCDHDRAVFVTTFREPPPRVREDVRDAVLARFPDRPLFARDVAFTATQKTRAAETLRAIWRTGYAVQSLDATGIVLEMPPLA